MQLKTASEPLCYLKKYNYLQVPDFKYINKWRSIRRKKKGEKRFSLCELQIVGIYF